MIDLSMVTERYQNVLSSRNQLAALLRDLYPKDNKRDINLALIVYDSGIASKISAMKYIDSQQMKIFVKQLDDDFGLQEQYALFGIEIWANAYKASIDKSEVCIVQPEKPKQPPPPPIKSTTGIFSKVGEIVTGDPEDYDVLERDNCFIISKYRGIEEKQTVVPNMINKKRITGIGEDAYRKCTDIESLEISHGIEFIEDGAFAGCTKLEKIIFPRTLKRIGSTKFTSLDGAFQNCRIKNMNLPDELVYLGKSAFSGCSELRKVILPDNLSIIDSFAFYNCQNLAEIHFPNSLKEIGGSAFSYCKSLETVILYDGLETIGFKAFGDCSSLTRFLMPGTVTKIDDIKYEDIFFDTVNHCKNKKLTVYCYPDSYGLEYARRHGYRIKYAYNYTI